MGNDLQKTLDFYKKRVEELEKTVVEINKSKFDKLMEKDILFHLKKELEEKDKENKRLLKNWKNSKLQQTRLYEKLKHQLHNQPKEIVEKIKHKLCDRLNKIAGYGRITNDELSFFVETEFAKDLEEILKEYEEE